ncbi:Gfo/Idh/MocA family oxidoreductase [Bdellovibrio sp. SKB1291214]|uniref:Gfo/Idh/MocA family protein n=1 Tax=Bdellovibrio sp. SKB1291214 TaxID=1732569 RepID=UPI001C3E5CE2|nr:Gfo/Idh/MocA family oxidoreductase [Bdellovibrio sp. SKB1291214]UYL07867.1 Gfo/Idh/MocA family oxidoreductase [Bdellovibrio sp. SKB1291214]
MKRKIRYAVVGLGHIAQVAVLPAFKNARSNSELVALVSSDKRKLKSLGKKYKVENLFSYEEYADLLKSGLIDAVYICTPNVDHKLYTVEAANAGIHVLVEKPLATTESDCLAMMNAVQKNKTKLMVAYRLHFEKANITASELIANGKIGEPRLFNSTFTYQLTDQDNIRLKQEKGGGPLFDIGTYCINASRYLFKEEPIEVFATVASHPRDDRFKEVEEMAAVTLRYPNAKLANFVVSFGTEASANFDVFGTKGALCLENAYEYTEDMTLTVTKKDKDQVREYKKRDQFAPEIVYFSECILNNKNPEPSALEGLADVKILNAIFKSAQSRKAVSLDQTNKRSRPHKGQMIMRPPHRKPKTVNVQSPHN